MSFYIVRRRRSVLAGIGASFVLLIGGTAVVQLRAADSWAAMEREVRDLRAAYDARLHRRTPLWGDATGDRAFVHYEQANSAARQLQKLHHGALIKLLPHPDARIAAEAVELRRAWQPVLVHLRAGAHAADVLPMAKPDADPKQQLINLLDARWVANAAIFETRALRHEGRPDEAVQWSLDAATYAADLMRGSTMFNQMIGVATLAIATHEAWRDDEALASLTPTALDALATGLERLDGSMPEALDLTHELLLCARALQGARVDDDWMPSMRSSWRYGFSTRWMIADAFVEYAATASELGSASAKAWPQRNAMFRLAGEEAVRSPNPLLQVVAVNLSSAEFNRREGITRLRLLRMAVDVHRGRDVPPLRDPLGDGPLVVKREDGTVRMTSKGSTERRKLERTVVR